MSYPNTQDLLIFVGIPLAVIAIVYALVYASGGRNAKRYRPGRPYSFAPVWFLARPETDGPAAIASGESHGHQAAVTAAGEAATDASVASAAPREHPGVTGGASDRW